MILFQIHLRSHALLWICWVKKINKQKWLDETTQQLVCCWLVILPAASTRLLRAITPSGHDGQKSAIYQWNYSNPFPYNKFLSNQIMIIHLRGSGGRQISPAVCFPVCLQSHISSMKNLRGIFLRLAGFHLISGVSSTVQTSQSAGDMGEIGSQSAGGGDRIPVSRRRR